MFSTGFEPSTVMMDPDVKVLMLERNRAEASRQNPATLGRLGTDERQLAGSHSRFRLESVDVHA